MSDDSPKAGIQPREHCWHSTGTGLSWGISTGGSDNFRCCHCGQNITRDRQVVVEKVLGHGPYETRTVTTYDWPTSKCPGPNHNAWNINVSIGEVG